MNETPKKLDAIEKRRSLLAFAASRATESTPGDEFSILLPIFRSIAIDRGGQIFSKDEVSSYLSEKFGLSATPDLIEYWVPQLVSAKVIRKSATVSDGLVCFWQDVARVSDGDRDHFGEKFDELVLAYREFAEQHGDLFLVGSTDEEIVAVIFDGVVNQLFDSGQELIFEKTNEDYYFGRFVEHLTSANKQDLIEFISYVRLCSVIVDLVFHLWTPTRHRPDLGRLRIYLDAPVVMDALGLNGNARKTRALKILSMLKELKSRIFLSDFYVNEIYENIDGYLFSTSSDRYGKMNDAVMRSEISDNFIRLLQSRLREAIEEIGLIIEPFDATSAAKGLMSEDHHNNLFARISSSYRNTKACNRDIDSIANVLARRGRGRPTKLENGIAVFVTSNSILTNQANRYATEQFGYKFGDVPISIQMQTIAGMMAGYFGIERSRDISIQELFAAASSAVSADPKVFEKLEATIRKIRPAEADQIVPLLRSDFSRLVLDGSAGRHQNVTEQSAEKIIANLTASFEKNAEEKVSQRYKSANTRIANERDVALQKLEAERRRQSHQLRMDFLSLLPFARRLSSMRSRAEKEYRIAFATVVAVLLVAIAAPFFVPSNQQILLLRIIFAGAAICGVLVGFLNREKLCEFWISFRVNKLKRDAKAAAQLLRLNVESFSAEDLFRSWLSHQRQLKTPNAE